MGNCNHARAHARAEKAETFIQGEQMPTATTRLPAVLALVSVVHGYHAQRAAGRPASAASAASPASPASPASAASPPPAAVPPAADWTGHLPSRVAQSCGLRECRTSEELRGQLPRRDNEEAIVLFSSRNCRKCHRLRRQVAEFSARKGRSRALFLQINYSPRTIDVFREFEVSATPTLLRLASNGTSMTVGSLRELKELLT